MEWPNDFASLLEVFVKGFGLLNTFFDKEVGEAMDELVCDGCSLAKGGNGLDSRILASSDLCTLA
jgi:hypothetical protein